MTNPYETMSPDDYDTALAIVMSNLTAQQILAIPGVYELVAEDIHNDVLDWWRERQEDPSDGE